MAAQGDHKASFDLGHFHLLDLSLPDPYENLAVDEALFLEAEEGGDIRQTLRLWEFVQPVVILGRSSCVDEEVKIDACRKHGIPLLRRISGGATVMGGPGCLMYSLVISTCRLPHFRSVEVAHRIVRERLAAALSRVAGPVSLAGISDLAVGDLKFSGNSCRLGQRTVLYHGTILYDFPVELMTQCLKSPPRQPEYRRNRNHERFVTNLNVSAQQLRRCLSESWQVESVRNSWPSEKVARLAVTKYRCESWIFEL